MARGTRRRGSVGSGSGGDGRRSARSNKTRRLSGIEKYGEDEIDEVLKLDADENAPSEAGSSQDGIEEEDVLAFSDNDNDDEDEEDDNQKLQGKAEKYIDSGSIDAVDETAGATTKGWQRREFYGGDDAGDQSDMDSEEDLVFQEARRLEDMRARRLCGKEDDLLAVLLAPEGAAEDAGAAEVGGTAAAVSASGTTSAAQFESLFAADAEHDSLPRDISQLPEAERRRLMQKESPELIPLLQDFKEKLNGFRELLPLLSSTALARLPTSGASYLEAKAALMLSTLTNLSFYLLLRAEGGAVREHPVVPQLVWLRELHEKVSPLDKQLAPKVRHALRSLRKAKRAATLAAPGTLPNPPEQSGANKAVGKEAETPIPRRRPTLRERIERLRDRPAASGGAESKMQDNSVKPYTEVATKDLLRLPKLRCRGGNANSDAPMDLDEVDPSLGAWLPKTTLGEQLSSVRQQLSEQASRARVVSADVNTEARARRAPRDRLSTESVPERIPEEEGKSERRLAKHREEEQADEEDELIRGASIAARAKKSRRAEKEVQREEARRLRQHRPEEVVEGRRKTTKKILENRGLVRFRKKQAGNARVSNKRKYTKALVRRKGAVQEHREAAADGATYEGEATGVRTHVRKSIKFG